MTPATGTGSAASFQEAVPPRCGLRTQVMKGLQVDGEPLDVLTGLVGNPRTRPMPRGSGQGVPELFSEVGPGVLETSSLRAHEFGLQGFDRDATGQPVTNRDLADSRLHYQRPAGYLAHDQEFPSRRNA